MVTNGAPIYLAAKTFSVPWSTLKDYLVRANFDPAEVHVVTNGRRPALPVDLEQQLLSYIKKMQETGFGLTATDVRRTAYESAEAAKVKHPFSTKEKIAGWTWWNSFSKRHNLKMRTPQNLSHARAAAATRANLDDFYEKLDKMMKKLKITNRPERIWNVDETGLSYVVKSNRIIAVTGARHVVKQSSAERGTNTTMVGCINANGFDIRPMIIFKCQRMDARLNNGPLPALIRLSKNGWINNDLFVEWLQHFVSSIPQARPVILIMDSHVSHVSEAALELAKKNQIHIMTFPSHTTHILQPLDVGIYGPLKSAWRSQLNTYMLEHPGSFSFSKNSVSMVVRSL